MIIIKKFITKKQKPYYSLELKYEGDWCNFKHVKVLPKNLDILEKFLIILNKIKDKTEAETVRFTYIGLSDLIPNVIDTEEYKFLVNVLFLPKEKGDTEPFYVGIFAGCNVENYLNNENYMGNETFYFEDYELFYFDENGHRYETELSI